MQYTEIWKPIPIKEVEGLYEVSSLGRIKSLPRLKHTPYGGTYLSKEKILKQVITNSGYLSVTLSNKPYNSSHFVHIIVASAFKKRRVGCGFVNHDDGNKLNNCEWNLDWCTRSENMIHAFNNGLIRKRKTSVKTEVGHFEIENQNYCL